MFKHHIDKFSTTWVGGYSFYALEQRMIFRKTQPARRRSTESDRPKASETGRTCCYRSFEVPGRRYHVRSAWLFSPKVWDNAYFVDLLEYDWSQAESPAGNTQWIPVLKDGATDTEVADIIMLTSDVALLHVRASESHA